MASSSSNTGGGKTWLLFVVAIVLGLLAAFFSVYYLKIREAAIRESLIKVETTAEVVVAKGDLPQGAVVSAQNMAVREIPVEYVHPDAISPDQFDAVTGKVLAKPLAEGRPLLQSFIAEEVAQDFSDTIRAGRRAMTIQVDEINSVAGLIRPGNFVDLFALLPAGTKSVDVQAAIKAAQAAGINTAALTPGGVTPSQLPPEVLELTEQQDSIVPVLQNIRVLATGREAADEYTEKLMLGNRVQEEYTTLTLDVTPKQAALLSMAQNKGDMLALLRNRKDTDGATFDQVVVDDLFSHAEQMAKEAAVRKSVRSLGNLTVNEKGEIVTPDGIVVKDPNIIVTADGRIMTKDGIDLTGRGLVIGADGRLQTADGKPVNAADLTLTETGELITKSGEVIGGNALHVDENGVIRDKHGNVVDDPDIYVDEQGRIVHKNGTVLSGKNVIVDKNGRIISVNGKTVSEAAEAAAGLPLVKGVKENAQGFIVDDSGNVMTKGGVLLKGVKVDKDGNVVLPSGEVVKASDLVIDADGTVRRKNGEVIKGVTGQRGTALARAMLQQVSAAAEAAGGAAGTPRTVDYIVGGESEGGVAKVKPVPVEK